MAEFGSNLGPFIAASEHKGLSARCDGEGRYWVEDAEGKEVDPKALPFTPEAVAAFTPSAADKDAGPAKPLKSGDYKGLAERVNNAAEFDALKAVLVDYFATKAGQE